MHKLSIIVLVLFFYGCERPDSEDSGINDEYFDLPFDLDDPTKTFEFDRELFEISGISWLDSTHIVAINDEEGILFVISTEDGQVTDRIEFGKDDDYEAVTTQDSLVYICESNGRIKVLDLKTREKIEEFDTFLSKRNDVEGLCHTPGGMHLLVACKGEMEDDHEEEFRAVYRFDLQRGQLEEEPFVVMHLIKSAIELADNEIHNNPVVSLTLKQRAVNFGPSAIDYDPVTGLIYILSSRGRLLVVTDKTDIKGIYFLNQRIYGQPEGLTFDTLGNLYIANEARSRKANLHFLKRMDPEERDTTSAIIKIK